MPVVDIKKLDQLEGKLQLMRSVAGAIECYKTGEAPVIESQAKYLRWPL